MGFIQRRTAGTAHKYRDRDREALASICGLELQLRDSIHGGERLFARPFSFRTGGMQDATMFSAKTIIFRAIIPLLCRKASVCGFRKASLARLCAFQSLTGLVPRACRKSWSFNVYLLVKMGQREITSSSVGP